ncbi:MAG: hypothetical protein MZV64_25955 [Ignavibacteriales bacterium]|nr:hypothetical protein [Ignavibacteriales bacterium]
MAEREKCRPDPRGRPRHGRSCANTCSARPPRTSSAAASSRSSSSAGVARVPARIPTPSAWSAFRGRGPRRARRARYSRRCGAVPRDRLRAGRAHARRRGLDRPCPSAGADRLPALHGRADVPRRSACGERTRARGRHGQRLPGRGARRARRRGVHGGAHAASSPTRRPATLEALGCGNVTVVTGDGCRGLRGPRPVRRHPRGRGRPRGAGRRCATQLADGGILVVPVGESAAVQVLDDGAPHGRPVRGRGRAWRAGSCPDRRRGLRGVGGGRGAVDTHGGLLPHCGPARQVPDGGTDLPTHPQAPGHGQRAGLHRLGQARPRATSPGTSSRASPSPLGAGGGRPWSSPYAGALARPRMPSGSSRGDAVALSALAPSVHLRAHPRPGLRAAARRRGSRVRAPSTPPPWRALAGRGAKAVVVHHALGFVADLEALARRRPPRDRGRLAGPRGPFRGRSACGGGGDLRPAVARTPRASSPAAAERSCSAARGRQPRGCGGPPRPRPSTRRCPT